MGETDPSRDRTPDAAWSAQPHPVDDRLAFAVGRLERKSPGLSAKTGLWPAQWGVLAASGFCLTAALTLAPGPAASAIECLLMLAFALVLAIRLLAIDHLVRGARRPATWTRADDPTLPVYTVLVALHDEATVVGELVRALSALDYPTNRLDILFVLEAHDRSTRQALESAGLAGHMRILSVPAGPPRTKPRALSYALTFARGDYVVVYDAEDEPEPGQLRLALASFAAGGPDTGCVQARLAIHNSAEGWLQAQFEIEYAALFGAILPALAVRGLPVPLGGTSNHFPRAVLESSGGWDPYNVTEDADLGLRLARLGWRVAVIGSVTAEEAPPGLRDWLAQRTRWQKGWMQTYFVHMRSPLRTGRELGLASWIWFQIVIGGGLLSALAHPWFYVWFGWQAAASLASPVAGPRNWTWLSWAALGCMVTAYAVTIALAAMTLEPEGRRRLPLRAPLVPFYWLLVSLAAYCAIWQWAVAPHYWAKTPHRPRRSKSRGA